MFLILPGAGRQGIDLAGDRIDGMQLILIMVVIALAAAILFYLKKISAQQEMILRRIDLLETISREGLPVERSNAGNPDDALPIGTPFPNFELPESRGQDKWRSNI